MRLDGWWAPTTYPSCPPPWGRGLSQTTTHCVWQLPDPSETKIKSWPAISSFVRAICMLVNQWCSQELKLPGHCMDAEFIEASAWSAILILLCYHGNNIWNFSDRCAEHSSSKHGHEIHFDSDSRSLIPGPLEVWRTFSNIHRALREADVILLLGARLNWILHFGRPPRFKLDVKIIQVCWDALTASWTDGRARPGVVFCLGLYS